MTAVPNQNFFRAGGREGGRGWNWALWKTFRLKQQKNRPCIKTFWNFFILDTLKTTIRIENLTRWWTQSGSFFVESRHFFQFSKREGEVFPLLPSCAPVSVAEYASISLNMSKYPCKCLNKLFWLCHGSDYAWLSYMFDRLLKIWIWQGCICRAEYVWLWLRTTQ